MTFSRYSLQYNSTTLEQNYFFTLSVFPWLLKKENSIKFKAVCYSTTTSACHAISLWGKQTQNKPSPCPPITSISMHLNLTSTFYNYSRSLHISFASIMFINRSWHLSILYNRDRAVLLCRSTLLSFHSAVIHPFEKSKPSQCASLVYDSVTL